jgi:phospholipase/carboxylesterase
MLQGPERPPAGGGAARTLVLLLHGLGADGNDLIGLAEPWAEILPNAHFAAPDAPEACDMAPMGRQWFSLSDRSPENMFEGVVRAADALNSYVDAKLAELGLSDSDLAFVGFSQGTMTSLHVAYRRAAACAGVLGFSGSMIAADRLKDELRARPPALLIHGDADDIVPVQATLESASVLGSCDILVQWHISRGIGHGIAPDGLEIGGRFLHDMLG